MTFVIDFGFHSFGRKSFIPVITRAYRFESAPISPKKTAAARSLNCSDHVGAEQEHRLDGILLEPGPQVRQEQPHCGEEPLDSDMRHRERSERETTPQWG